MLINQTMTYLTSMSGFGDWRISTHVNPTSTCRTNFIGKCHKSPEASDYKKGALANTSDFGLLGEQSSQKLEIPALDADELPYKIWRC